MTAREEWNANRVTRRTRTEISLSTYTRMLFWQMRVFLNAIKSFAHDSRWVNMIQSSFAHGGVAVCTEHVEWEFFSDNIDAHTNGDWHYRA